MGRVVKMREAHEAQARDPEVPVAINAGRCEARVWTAYGRGYCGARGRWLVRSEIRCGTHKDDES